MSTLEERERRRSNSLLAAAQPKPQQQKSLGAYGAGQATRQALGTAASTAYGPYRAAGRAIGDAAGGAMNFGRGLLGMQQPQGADSAVGAQPGPTIPRVQQQPAQPPPRSFRDNPAMASTQPSMNPQQTRSLALQSAQSQSPIGMARQTIAGGPPLAQGEQRLMGQAPARTRYAGLGGTAEFQGMRQGGGGFGGAATNAQAAARLADYRSRGLDQFGNDRAAIGQLNQTADSMRAANQEQLSSLRASREASAREGELIGLRGAMQRASFSDVAEDQQRGEMAERRLAQLGAISPQQDLYGTQQGLALQRQGLQQQGAQAQSQAQAQARQQAIDNRLAFERLGLDREKFDQQVEQDGRVDTVALSEQIAGTYDPFNAPKDADGNPVDQQTYIRQTLNGMFQAIGKVVDPNGQVYNAGEIQAVADQYFGGDVEAARRDMQAKGFLGI